MVINLHVHEIPYREWLVKLCRASNVLCNESKYWGQKTMTYWPLPFDRDQTGTG